MALFRHGRELWRRGETAGDKIMLDHVTGPVSMWNTRVIMRGIIGKERFQCRCHCMGKLILLDSVPDVEKKKTAWAKDSSHFCERSWFVRKKHDPELTKNCVECPVGEGQRDDVCLPPFHRSPDPDRLGLLNHAFIQVCRD